MPAITDTTKENNRMIITLQITPKQQDYYQNLAVTVEAIQHEATQELTLIIQDRIEDPTTIDTLYINPKVTVPIKVTKPTHNHYVVTVVTR